MSEGILDSVAKLINSPPGQLAAGSVLFGCVYKLFERVENVLNDDTKLEIAVWLLGVRTSEKVRTWPETFNKVFDQVFGRKHLSVVCFLRSVIVSCVILFVCYVDSWLKLRARLPALPLTWKGTVSVLGIGIAANALPDYLSLLKTRYLLGKLPSVRQPLWIFILAVDFGIDVIFGYISLIVASVILIFSSSTSYANAMADLPFWISEYVHFRVPPEFVFWFYPAFFTSLWLWLYAGSGFILKATRRFDLGFNWFNRHFDIEKKPLQSIGLVSSVLVAGVYLAVVAIWQVAHR